MAWVGGVLLDGYHGFLLDDSLLDHLVAEFFLGSDTLRLFNITRFRLLRLRIVLLLNFFKKLVNLLSLLCVLKF